MRRAAALSALIVSLVMLGSGCTTRRAFTWIDEEPLPKTRAELYQRYGPPAQLRRQGAYDFLRYDYRVGKGMKAGIGSWASFIFGRDHTMVDNARVKIDADDRVLEITSDRYSEEFGHRLWPFGD